jgi:succinate dehydrogenase / fumarate reductase membrane anchor subunit
MLNPLARARGLGSAKQGVHHWYLQRATALLLIPLTAWLLYAMVRLSGAGYEAAMAFLSSPFHAACAVLLAVSGLYHAMLGLQVVIEDYVHTRSVDVTLQLAVKALGYAGMAFSAIYIFRLAIA